MSSHTLAKSSYATKRGRINSDDGRGTYPAKRSRLHDAVGDDIDLSMFAAPAAEVEAEEPVDGKSSTIKLEEVDDDGRSLLHRISMFMPAQAADDAENEVIAPLSPSNKPTATIEYGDENVGPVAATPLMGAAFAGYEMASTRKSPLTYHTLTLGSTQSC